MVVDNCRLYRKLYDIMHPSISRKNISEYQIILQDDLIPVRIFYPDTDAKLDKIVIYVHGSKVNYQIYEDFAKKTNSIVIFLDYKNENMVNDCNNMIKYILEELVKCSINLDNVMLVGDFLDSDFILNLEDINNIKKILLFPKIEGKLELNNLFVIAAKDVDISCDHLYKIDERVEDFTLYNNIVLNDKIYKIIHKIIVRW